MCILEWRLFRVSQSLTEIISYWKWEENVLWTSQNTDGKGICHEIPQEYGSDHENTEVLLGSLRDGRATLWLRTQLPLELVEGLLWTPLPSWALMAVLVEAMGRAKPPSHFSSFICFPFWFLSFPPLLLRAIFHICFLLYCLKSVYS